MCSICVELGRESVNHKFEYCYLNPRSKSFKQDEYNKKMAYLRRNNLPIPAAMQDLPPAPDTPAP
jgi:hypothetical protein